MVNGNTFKGINPAIFILLPLLMEVPSLRKEFASLEANSLLQE